MFGLRPQLVCVQEAASGLLRLGRVSFLLNVTAMLAGSRVRCLPSLPLPRFAGIRSGLAPRSGQVQIPPLA